MKITAYIFLFLSLFACNTETNNEQIENLNGYWAISKAERADGSVKDYAFSGLVDYIEIENNKGFRKKVKPKMDGTYFITNNEENIVVKVENDSINLYYSTKMDNWKETLISSGKNEIVLENEDGNKYTYKRFNLDLGNGEEKQ